MSNLLVAAAMVAGVLMPPSAYDHEPVVPYTVRYISQQAADDMCWQARFAFAFTNPGKKTAVLGCTDLRTNSINIVRTLKPGTRAAVLRHEKAHVNGWRHK